MSKEGTPLKRFTKKDGHCITNRDLKFAKMITKGINDDYPGKAFVFSGCCYITNEHWEFCQNTIKEKYTLKRNR